MHGNIDDGLIFDVGMHMGEDTAYYLRKGFRVVAFEANPELVAHCEHRFADALSAGLLTIVSGAIADSAAETVTFHRHPTLSVWGTADPSWAQRNVHQGTSTTLTVPAVNFSKALATHGIPHYAKIDVEGADQLCVDAIASDSRPRYLSIESDKTSLPAVRDELDRFEALGYSQFCAAQQQGMERRTITTTGRDGRPLTYGFEPHASGPFGEDLTWSDKATVMAQYERIFARYRRFGDASVMGRYAVGRIARRQLNRFGAFPGWYDTHARLAGPS